VEARYKAVEPPALVEAVVVEQVLQIVPRPVEQESPILVAVEVGLHGMVAPLETAVPAL